MVRSLTAKKPRKRKTASTSKRRKSDPSPSEKQWLSWKQMQFCAINDLRNNERVIFQLGENVTVLNHNWQPNRYYDPWEFWVAKIVAIRGNSPRNTWVKVQWYYSGKDITEKDPALDTSSYGRYERSLSVVDSQMISALSINGKAEVVEFDENSLDQEPILPDVFYTRREFDSHEGVTPPIAVDTSTCICQQLYNPDAIDPMHFCPHCKRWYHRNCLAENGHTSLKPANQCMPDFLDIPATCRSDIPWDLLQLACVPIIRGGPAHGVVGNVKSVSEARKWADLYAHTPWTTNDPAPQLNGITLDRWLDGLDGVEVEELVYPGDEDSGNTFAKKDARDKEQPLPFDCPSCGKLI